MKQRSRTLVSNALLIEKLQLPFTVSWQQIKDYVRQVCDVDHVEVFQKSTSGWVRVKGRENFGKAFSMTLSFSHHETSLCEMVCMVTRVCAVVDAGAHRTLEWKRIRWPGNLCR